MMRRSGLILGALAVIPLLGIGQQYRSYIVKKDRLAILLQEGELDIQPLTAKAIRVLWTKDLPRRDSELILNHYPRAPAFTCTETTAALRVSTHFLIVTFDKRSGAIEYRDKAGHVFLRETAGSRQLKPDTVMGQPCYMAGQTFESPADEELFGLGQFQDGNFNLRNISRRLIQVNTQIAIPFLYSSKNYGLLWHQYGITEFNPADSVVELSKQDSLKGDSGEAEVTTTSGTQRVTQRQALYTGSFMLSRAGDYCVMLDLGNMDNRHLLVIDGHAVIDESNYWLPPAAGKLIGLSAGLHTVQVVCRSGNVPRLSWRAAVNETTFRSPNASRLDYIVFTGTGADDVIAGYRDLSGKVPLLPLWAYGFWQCRERYTSGEHLRSTVEEFRKRQLPLDVIVQDWQYWGKYGWGVPKFDEDHYPDPDHFIRQLHDLHAHFVISVWENLDKRSEVARPYVEKNLYLPNSPWIDIFNPETRTTHWAALNDNLFRHGVDGWWMDATEPENDALKGKQTYLGPGDFYRLTYPLFVSRAVYEGQRAADPAKRVCILTRSAFAGQQRYGTINWSGDIGSNWDAYRRQIVAGLDYSMTGMPYWTTDIGGFFRPGKGQYTDPGYRELLTRWFQWGALNPVFRVHGYQTETEPWNYGDSVMENMRTMLDLRYRLMPYIYSMAWQVTRYGSTIMRPLVMDFGKDSTACKQQYEYMFGKALLAVPVTEAGSREVEVYLPGSTAWYDLWTGRRYPGGRIRADAPLERMPIFVRAGSVVPFGPAVQSTAEADGDSLEIRVYTGVDGQFTLYFDQGDGYNYEKGKYQEIPLIWDDHRRILSIGAASGSYAGVLKHRVFRVVAVSGVGQARSVRMVRYAGTATAVQL
jgi:alpha-D-xyloside xylohydrolase